MKKIRILSLACAAVLLLCLCSCAPDARAIPMTSVSSATTVFVTDAETGAESVQETTLPATDTVYPLSLVDSYGNQTVIPSEPMRIVSCAPNITELLFKLDAGAKIVGRTDYCNYPAEVSEIPSVGSIDIPSIEAIVALEPDLIIASSIFTESSYNALTELGYTVVVYHEEYDLNGVGKMIRSVGEIVNRIDQGNAAIGEMDALIEEAVSRTIGKDRPTVYYAVSFGEYGDYTAGGDTYIHQLIDKAGGDNIAADVTGWSFSIERLIETDPDVILVNQYMLEDFFSTEPYSGLSAVRNGRVYGIDSDLLERQGYRNAEGIERLVSFFYPEQTKSEG